MMDDQTTNVTELDYHVLKQSVSHHGRIPNTLQEFTHRKRRGLIHSAIFRPSGHRCLSAPMRSVMRWRRGQDSNLRQSHPYNGFQDRRLKPLGHPSTPAILQINTSKSYLYEKTFPKIQKTKLPVSFQDGSRINQMQSLNRICPILPSCSTEFGHL